MCFLAFKGSKQKEKGPKPLAVSSEDVAHTSISGLAVLDGLAIDKTDAVLLASVSEDFVCVIDGRSLLCTLLDQGELRHGRCEQRSAPRCLGRIELRRVTPANAYKQFTEGIQGFLRGSQEPLSPATLHRFISSGNVET